MLPIPIITCLALAACMTCANGDEAPWLKVAAAPVAWSDATVIAHQQRLAFVLDSPAQTQLRGFLLKREMPVPDIAKQAADLLETLPRPEESVLTIDWLGNTGANEGFTRDIHPQSLGTRSVHRVENTTITRTVLAGIADDVMLIHFIADQPGALSFRVTLGGAAQNADVRIEDRRQLILGPKAGQLGAHVWVLPFESDVASEGNTITVRGEGEALIVWNFAVGKPPEATLSNLGARYDAGHNPPNPAKIWQGALETLGKACENSP